MQCYKLINLKQFKPWHIKWGLKGFRLLYISLNRTNLLHSLNPFLTLPPSPRPRRPSLITTADTGDTHGRVTEKIWSTVPHQPARRSELRHRDCTLVMYLDKYKVVVYYWTLRNAFSDKSLETTGHPSFALYWKRYLLQACQRLFSMPD